MRLLPLFVGCVLAAGVFLLPMASAAEPAKPQLVRANIAVGKPSSASSEESGKKHFAADAVDGNPETRWCAAGPKPGEWWQVDLTQPENLTGCQLEWESSSAPYRCKIEGSADAQQWRTLVDASANTAGGARVHDFAAPGTRYLRVTFLGNDTGGWASLREVQVYTDKTIALDPDTVTRQRDQTILDEVKVPEGFEVKVFATPPMVSYPVFVAAATDGTVYVSSDRNGSIDRKPNRGSILRVRDVDGDGHADEVKRFVADVDSPRGLVWDHDRLYLMHPPHLSAYIDHDHDGIADEEQVLVKNIAFSFKDRPADHTSNGVSLGIDGWLYLAIGDFGFMEAEGTDGCKLQLRGGGVVRVRPDGTGLELYSRGTRNILEVEIDPLLNGFARDNTNDGGGWDIRLHHFSGLEQHGYPSLFKTFPEEIVQPLADYGGGSGCGGLYLDEPGFPAGYGNALYTADWGRQWVFRHHLTPHGATFDADQDECFGVPRVTDLDVDAESRLYLASWKGATFTYTDEYVGYLVRVSPQGYRAEPLPAFDKLNRPALVALLESPSHRRRLEAQRALIRRGIDGPTATALEALAANDAGPLAGRVAAVFALKQGLHGKAVAALVRLAAVPSIREYALRALTDRREELSAVPAAPIVAGLADPQPRVRLQATISLARLGQVEHALALTPLLADVDPIVAHTAAQALVVLKAADTCFAVLDRRDASADERQGAAKVLQALHEPAVVNGLATRLEKETNPARRLNLLAALCRLYNLEGPWKAESWGTRPDTSGPYYKPETWSESVRIADVLKHALAKAHGDEASGLLFELNRNKVQLDGSLDTIVAMASQDPAVIPAAIGQLSRSATIPAQAIPLLVKVAGDEATAPITRSQCILSLMKTDSPEAFQVALSALVRLEKKARGTRDFELARDAILNSPQLENQHDWLAALAEKCDGPASAWADAALLIIANRGSPEARTSTTAALDSGWRQPERRAQIVSAVALARYRPYRDRVLLALTDPDRAVAAAAKKTVGELRFDREAAFAAKAKGPPLETMKIDAVVAAALAEHGDPVVGEELFVRLSCTKCHTTRADEPLRGPFLGTIANTYKRRDLAESVLIPSKSIAQGFATNQFVLDDGRQLTGFVTLEAADKITVRDLEGKEYQIPTASIEERSKLPISTMPEGLVKTLTIPEFASLLDYLELLAKAKK